MRVRVRGTYDNLGREGQIKSSKTFTLPPSASYCALSTAPEATAMPHASELTTAMSTTIGTKIDET